MGIEQWTPLGTSRLLGLPITSGNLRWRIRRRKRIRRRTRIKISRKDTLVLLPMGVFKLERLQHEKA